MRTLSVITAINMLIVIYMMLLTGAQAMCIIMLSIIMSTNNPIKSMLTMFRYQYAEPEVKRTVIPFSVIADSEQ